MFSPPLLTKGGDFGLLGSPPPGKIGYWVGRYNWQSLLLSPWTSSDSFFLILRLLCRDLNKSWRWLRRILLFGDHSEKGSGLAVIRNDLKLRSFHLQAPEGVEEDLEVGVDVVVRLVEGQSVAEGVEDVAVGRAGALALLREVLAHHLHHLVHLRLDLEKINAPKLEF